jgi:hypothetical protein
MGGLYVVGGALRSSLFKQLARNGMVVGKVASSQKIERPYE